MKLEREGKDLLPCVAKWRLEMAFPSLKERERKEVLQKCILYSVSPESLERGAGAIARWLRARAALGGGGAHL